MKKKKKERVADQEKSRLLVQDEVENEVETNWVRRELSLRI